MVARNVGTGASVDAWKGGARYVQLNRIQNYNGARGGAVG